MIDYKLQRPQENFIKKKLIPMLENSEETEVLWKNTKIPTENVLRHLNRIIDDGRYTQPDSELLEDLKIVYQKTKNK